MKKARHEKISKKLSFDKSHTYYSLTYNHLAQNIMKRVPNEKKLLDNFYLDCPTMRFNPQLKGENHPLMLGEQYHLKVMLTSFYWKVIKQRFRSETKKVRTA